jgi:hypothetical protein
MDDATKRKIAVENLNRLPQMRLYHEGEEPLLALYVTDGKYSHDLEAIGVKEREGKEGWLIYQQGEEGEKDHAITVRGEQSLQKLAEAGVNFPGADLFGTPHQSHAQRLRGS